MANYCNFCGKPLDDGALKCSACGKEVGASQPENNNSEATGNTEKSGFFSSLIRQITDLLKHPKKLIPTFVMSGVWILFSILSVVGVNIPIFRFLYTITYSNGGMFGGFFGTVGGMFGKAVFATVVNTVVLSLCAKKNPFAGINKTFASVFGNAAFSGLSSIAPFLIGAGSGVILYWFFNITSSPVNCAIAVVGAVGAILSLSKKNSLLISLIFSVAGKLTRGKTPSQIVVTRALTGFSAGFALGLPLTFARFGWLLFLVGALILSAGIVFAIVGKNVLKKAAATAAVLVIFGATLSPMFFGVNAANDSLPNKYVPMEKVFRLEDGDGSQPINYKKVDGFFLVLDSMTSYGIGLYGDDALYGAEPSLNAKYQTASQTISAKPSVLVSHNEMSDGFTVSGTWDWKHTYLGEEGSVHNAGDNQVYRSDLALNISNITFEDCHIYADIEGTLNSAGGSNDSYDKTETLHLSGTHLAGDYKLNSDTKTVYVKFYVGEASSSSTNASMIFRIAGVLPASSAGAVVSDKDTSKPDETDDDVRPYKNRLTYTNGRKNKYGQPFPDLMDFDGDGKITWLDSNIQKELSHDPDWLHRPTSKALGTFLAILTGLLGTAGGLIGSAAGSIAGGLASGAGEAASEIASSLADGISNDTSDKNEKEDLGPYIRRDGDGDLNVTDPATGENRLYTANGDGTYTNPLTGATYTEQELKDSLESRAENSELIRQDEAVKNEAINEQREENQGKSQITKELEAEAAAQRAQEEKEAAQKKYVEGLADKYGVYSGDDDLRTKIGEKQGQAEIERYEQTELEEEYRKSQTYTENVKKGADFAIDVYAAVDPTKTGQKFKDGYTVATAAASNAGDVMAGNKSMGGAFVQTVVDSTVELAKNHSEGVTQKLASNIMGDSVKAMSDTYMKGGSVEDIRKAGEGAAIQGGINAAVDVTFDAFGGAASEKMGLTGKKVIGSVGGQQITKGMAGKGTETLANDLVKNGLTLTDSDEAALEKLHKEQAQAEADANKEAIERFKEAQKEWAERSKNDSEE